MDDDNREDSASCENMVHSTYSHLSSFFSQPSTFNKMSPCGVATSILCLPSEILDCIFGEVADKDNDERCRATENDLRNLCQVCKTFFPIARPYLFRYISTSVKPIPGPREPVFNLTRILTEKPEITGFIKTLNLRFSPGDWDYYDGGGSLLTAENIKQSFGHFGDERIMPLFKLLSLGCLIIYAYHSAPYSRCSQRVGWLTYRCVLDHYVSVGSLTTLSLYGIHDLPVDVILAPPSLRTLFLSTCVMAKWGLGTSLAVRTSSLEELTIRMCADIPFSLFFYLPRLRYLSTNISLWNPDKIHYPQSQPGFPFSELQTLETGANLKWILEFASISQRARRQPFPRLRNLICEWLEEVDSIDHILEHSDTVESLSIVTGTFSILNPLTCTHPLYRIRRYIPAKTREYEEYQKALHSCPTRSCILRCSSKVQRTAYQDWSPQCAHHHPVLSCLPRSDRN